MGLRDKVAGAEMAGKRGQYLGPGNHTGVIQAIKEIQTRKKEDAVVLELKVEETDSEETYAGDVYTVMWMIDRHESAAGQFKRALADIVGCDEDGIDQDFLNTLFDEKCLDGTRITVRSRNIKTESNNDFTLHNFEPAA